MNRPYIALSGSLPDEKITTINNNYLRSIWCAGGVPTLLLPSTDEDYIKTVCETFDGFLFCGGDDIDPKYYGEEKSPEIGDISPARDEFEEKLFHAAYATGKPILGICRGLQVINVFLGGSLIQHMNGHRSEDGSSPSTHDVVLVTSSPLTKITDKTEFTVNSFHHQAINSLSSKLTADAYSKNDGYIEAFHEEGNRFLYAVQWHPESLYKTSEVSRKLFKAFIDACEGSRSNQTDHSIQIK